MIRALKGRTKVTKRVEDIFVENLLWPGADFVEKWARLNEDKKSFGICSIFSPVAPRVVSAYD